VLGNGLGQGLGFTVRLIGISVEPKLFRGLAYVFGFRVKLIALGLLKGLGSEWRTS
jgi:hypothetical protein